MATRITQAQLNKFISPEAAMAPYERAQQDKTQKNAQDADLHKLITGKDMDQAIEQEKYARQLETAKALRNQYGDQVAVDAGDVSIGGRDQLANFLKAKQAESLDEDRALRRQERFGNALTKANLPGRAADMAAVEAVTKSKDGGGMITNPKYVPKSAGPIINAFPHVLMGAAVAGGEKLGLLPQGAAEERRAIQRIQNVDTKQLSGTAVTPFEEAKNKIAQGQSLGGDPDLLRQGIVQAYKVLQSEGKNIESSFPQDTKNRYRAEGGEYDVDAIIRGGGELSGGQRSQPVPFDGQGAPETKTVHGHTYQKVGGVWKKMAAPVGAKN